jgi:hypothetical protein
MERITVLDPSADVPVAQTATRLPDGRVLIAGGRDISTDVDDAEIGDSKTGTFSPVGSGG